MIHHSTLKKAEKAGFTLTEEADDRVTAFWPKRSLRIVGNSGPDAMAQMQAAMALANGDQYRVVPDPDQTRLVEVYDETGQRLAGGPRPPVAAHAAIFLKKDAQWEEPTHGDDDSPHGDDSVAAVHPVADSQPAIERINGIAVHGGVAYREGTPAGDCPFGSETDDEQEYVNFERWNEEWDAAADEASDEEGKGTGTVVKEKYRAKYAEMGHPTHCGDWLAETLNNLVLNKGGTNIELFEEICKLNGVDTSKYKRTGVGWQGRIRMTGRNLMAKKVYQRGGTLILPQTLNGGSMQAPGEWMAMQRFKTLPKADQQPAAIIAVRTA